MKSIYDGIANYKNHKTPVSKSLDKTKTLLKDLTKEAFRDDFNLVRNFVVEHILNNSDEEVFC